MGTVSGGNLNLRCHTLGPELVPSHQGPRGQSLCTTNEKASIKHLVPGCLTLALIMSVPSVHREGAWEIGYDLDCLHRHSHDAHVQTWLWMLAAGPSSVLLPMEARVQNPAPQ